MTFLATNGHERNASILRPRKSAPPRVATLHADRQLAQISRYPCPFHRARAARPPESCGPVRLRRQNNVSSAHYSHRRHRAQQTLPAGVSQPSSRSPQRHVLGRRWCPPSYPLQYRHSQQAIPARSRFPSPVQHVHYGIPLRVLVRAGHHGRYHTSTQRYTRIGVRRTRLRCHPNRAREHRLSKRPALHRSPSRYRASYRTGIFGGGAIVPNYMDVSRFSATISRAPLKAGTPSNRFASMAMKDAARI